MDGDVHLFVFLSVTHSCC